MKDARDRIKRRGKAIPMHQNGESVVEVQKALSVDVSQAPSRCSAPPSDRTAAARVVPSGKMGAAGEQSCRLASGGAEISSNMSGLSSKDLESYASSADMAFALGRRHSRMGGG